MHRVHSSILLALVCGCVSSDPLRQAQRNASATPGCYFLSLGEWSYRVGDERSHYTPPDTFQLLDSGKVTPTIPYSYRPERGRARWIQVAPDSLRVEWSNGFALAVLRLRQAGDVSAGTLEAISDAQTIPPAPPRLAPASVRRIACSSAARRPPNER